MMSAHEQAFKAEAVPESSNGKWNHAGLPGSAAVLPALLTCADTVPCQMLCNQYQLRGQSSNTAR